jgi:hypothetical protein
VTCKKCSDDINLTCLCGTLYCSGCEDDCPNCVVTCLWKEGNKTFQGFHSKSQNNIPDNCLVKFRIINKGVDTTHLGLTSDCDFKWADKPTENFWSLCLNSGEKFSTESYKKKGIAWSKYSIQVTTGDIVHLKYFKGDLSYIINGKAFPVAYTLDKDLKLFLLIPMTI